MSIKSTIQKKKMQKSGSMLDAFVAEQMYNRIETIIDGEFKGHCVVIIADGVLLRDLQ